MLRWIQNDGQEVLEGMVKSTTITTTSNGGMMIGESITDITILEDDREVQEDVHLQEETRRHAKIATHHQDGRDLMKDTKCEAIETKGAATETDDQATFHDNALLHRGGEVIFPQDVHAILPFSVARSHKDLEVHHKTERQKNQVKSTKKSLLRRVRSAIEAAAPAAQVPVHHATTKRSQNDEKVS